MHAFGHRVLLLAERTSWALAVVGLVWYGASRLQNAASTRDDLERFAALRAVTVPTRTPDQTLWSPARITARQAALREPAAAPLAVLRIAKIGLEVPVLPGTDDRTLDRAV